MNWNTIFDYAPETGQLLWKTMPLSAYSRQRDAVRFNTMRAGTVAGNPNKAGYIKLSVNKRMHYVHRIVWEMHHGPIPTGMVIDHANRDKSDNRLCNLRLATHAQNFANSKARSHNRSGLKGVVAVGESHSGRKKWRARIAHNGLTRFLGYFHTKEEAHHAYMQELTKRHREFAS
jgi:intein-encoded DNA endonuclease-like protein